MKKFFLQNFFSQLSLQKFLLLMVLLTFSGCEVDFRQGYVSSSPHITSREFLSYFTDTKYGDYTYYTYDASKSSLTSVNSGVEYTYILDSVDSADDALSGEFESDTGDTLTATVNTTSGDIILSGIPFLDYLEDGKTYTPYTYSKDDKALISSSGSKYIYIGTVEGNDKAGMFKNEDTGHILTVTVS